MLAPYAIHTVRSSVEFCKFLDWLRTRDGRYVALDTETSDADDLYRPQFRVRLIQIGDAVDAWLFHWDEWGRAAAQALMEYRDRILIHNAAFDMAVLHRQGYRLNWAQVTDTMLAMRIAEPNKLSGLKESSDRHLSPDADLSQKDLKTAMRRNGWTWDTVPLDLPIFVEYSGLDPILTARLYEAPVVQEALRSPVWQLEMDTAALCARMAQRGMRVDVEMCQRRHDRLAGEAELVRARAQHDHGLNLRSTQDCSAWFKNNPDSLPLLTKPTASGKGFAVDKDVLSKIMVSIPGTEASAVAAAMLEVRSKEKIAASYFKVFIDQADGDGMVHPQILTSEARSSRMCVPDSHGLLTRRGVVGPDDIQVGDETIDMYGSWVKVEAVHRYADQPTEIRSHSTYSLESTAEHRWVTSSGRGVLRVEPLSDKVRRQVHLAPLGAPLFDPAVLHWDAATDGETFAAIVGLLVTDGRCTTEKGGLIYQTERKFYDEIISLLPMDAVRSDIVRASGDHHEVRLKSRWLLPRLAAAGLTIPVGRTLRDSVDLTTWVLKIPVDEARQFLTSVWLADGRSGYADRPAISCASPQVQMALRIAAYRCGWTTSVGIYPPSGWGTKPREVVRLRKPRVITRHMDVKASRSDVWCVSTSSGTMTAWHPEHGPYLTGNSIRKPALQTLPKDDATGVRGVVLPCAEGEDLISSDWDQIEMRLAAVLSNDEGLLQAFRDADASGGDFFTSMGAEIYHDPGFRKEDPRRRVVKNAMYGSLYGAGAIKIAATAGITLPEATETLNSIFTRYPGLRRLMRGAEAQAKRNGHVTTMGGRRLDVEPAAAYKALNYIIQGCLPYDAPVLTRNSGFTPIGEFIDGSDVWTGERWASAVRIPKGEDERVRVHLSDGRNLDCDTRHQFLALTEGSAYPEWLSVLKAEGVTLVRDAAPTEWGHRSTEYSYGELFWLGYMLGNGTIRPNNDLWSIVFPSSIHKGLADELFSWGLSRPDIFRGATNSKTGICQDARTKHSKSITVYGGTRSGHAYWTRLTGGGGAHTKRIPPWVFQLDRDGRQAVFNGIYAADGTDTDSTMKRRGVTAGVRPRTVSWEPIQRPVGYTSANRSLAEDVLTLAGTLGHTGHITTYTYVRGGKDVTHYTVLFRKNIQPLTVTSVERLGIWEPMYTLSVDDERHAFATSGVLSKNSAAVLLKRALVDMACAGLEDFLVIPVHDEVVLSVPRDSVEDVREVVGTIMPINDLPLAIGAEPSLPMARWGAAA